MFKIYFSTEQKTQSDAQKNKLKTKSLCNQENSKATVVFTFYHDHIFSFLQKALKPHGCCLSGGNPQGFGDFTGGEFEEILLFVGGIMRYHKIFLEIK